MKEDNRDIYWKEELDEWENDMPIETCELFEPTNEETYSFEGDEYYDDVLLDIDYSELRGPFKKSMGKIKHKIKRAPRKRKKPLSKDFLVENKERRNIVGGRKQINKVVIPEDRPVIIEGVSDFILDNQNDEIKQIGYYKGKKLKEMVIAINNTSGVDFEMELFNPSAPLDFLQSTSGNLNDRMILAGGAQTSYSDMLYNILANPTLIANARITVTGTQVKEQLAERLTFVNKNVAGEAVINPLSIALNMDLFQQQSNVILFNITKDLNRVYIVDGMDIMRYRVLAGNTVTFCFYYKQKSLKKFFWKEARVKNLVLDKMQEIL